MKKHKKLYITVITLTALLVLFFFPMRRDHPEGSREYKALAYRVIIWYSITDVKDIGNGVSVYIFPDNFRDYESYLAERATQAGESGTMI